MINYYIITTYYMEVISYTYAVIVLYDSLLYKYLVQTLITRNYSYIIITSLLQMTNILLLITLMLLHNYF
jgi:hypothetical protein